MTIDDFRSAGTASTTLNCSTYSTVFPGHSHSIISSNHNALNSGRELFLRVVKNRLPVRQKFALLNSNRNFTESESMRFGDYRHRSFDP